MLLGIALYSTVLSLPLMRTRWGKYLLFWIIGGWFWWKCMSHFHWQVQIGIICGVWMAIEHHKRVEAEKAAQASMPANKRRRIAEKYKR